MKSNVSIAVIKTDQNRFFPYMIFFGVNASHVKHMLSFYNITPLSIFMFPLWLSRLIVFVASYFPLTWLSVKKLQDLMTQFHNSIETNYGTTKSLLTMIAKNNGLVVRYYLISMHYDVQRGLPFSKAILHLLEEENPFYAAMMEEAEQGSQINTILNEISGLLLLKTHSRFKLLRILIPTFIAIIVSLYLGNTISYYLTAAKYNLIVQFHAIYPELYPYSNLMAIYENFFQADHFYYLLIRNSSILFILLLAFTIFRSSKFYPYFLSVIEYNIPFFRQRQRRLISIELLKLLAISRITNMNIYQSLHRTKLHIRNKLIQNKVNHALSLIDQGITPMSAMKQMNLLPMTTHYILDRLIHSNNLNDLNNVSSLCSQEYDHALNMLNEAYRTFAIIIVLTLVLFIGLNYIDNMYYYNIFESS